MACLPARLRAFVGTNGRAYHRVKSYSLPLVLLTSLEKM